MLILFLKVSDKRYSKDLNGGADMGMSCTYCYLWNEEQKIYKKIQLGMTGDIIKRNLDKEAIKLDYWLRCDIGGEDRERLESTYQFKG